MIDLSSAAGHPIAMDEAVAAARATVLLLTAPPDAV
jgi:hypothetical protein